MATDKPRLVTTLPPPIDRRLRMQAAIRRWTVTRVLVDVLDKGLPSTEDLAVLMREGETTDDGTC